MATAITENPIASAIVTAQTEIHMVGSMIGSPLNALMQIWFRWRVQSRDQTGYERSMRQFRNVRGPIARIWVRSTKATEP